MAKVKNISLSRLHQGESFEFHTSVVKNMIETPTFVNDPTVVTYRAAVTAYDGAFKQQRESALTNDVAIADERNDKAWRGLNKANKAALDHYSNNVAAAAHAIDVVIRNYGDPTKLSYPNETARIYNLCQDLDKPANVAHINVIGIKGWVDELKAANKAFSETFAKRGNEQYTLITGLTKEKRIDTENAYRKAIEKLEAMLIMGPTAQLNTMAEKINYYVDYYNNIIATRRGRAEAKNSKQS